MPRRREVPKRKILPDPVYGSPVIAKFICAVMRKGKKSTAESVIYGALDRIKEMAKEEPLKVFNGALNNIKPTVEVKSRRVGGSTYQVPVEINEERRQSLAFRWLLAASKSRSGHSMEEKLAGEIADAFHNRGTSIKKKEDTHRMAEANRAFAHYRW